MDDQNCLELIKDQLEFFSQNYKWYFNGSVGRIMSDFKNLEKPEYEPKPIKDYYSYSFNYLYGDFKDYKEYLLSKHEIPNDDFTNVEKKVLEMFNSYKKKRITSPPPHIERIIDQMNDLEQSYAAFSKLSDEEIIKLSKRLVALDRL